MDSIAEQPSLKAGVRFYGGTCLPFFIVCKSNFLPMNFIIMRRMEPDDAPQSI